MISREEFFEALISRHGIEIHNKINSKSIAVCGLGGLGSNLSIALARAGIGHLHLIDFDVVDATNLNRQQYFIKHLGMKKTEALKSILNEINPFMKITVSDIKVDNENIKSLFTNEDIIAECFDSAAAKAMLIDGISENYSDKYIVSASGMAGYGNSNEIITRKINNKFYICGDGFREGISGRGLMAPRVMLCSAHESNKILEIIIDEM